MADAPDESVDSSRQIIGRVATDDALAPQVRKVAAGLLTLAESNPALADLQLRDLYAQEAHRLSVRLPDEALCRTVSIDTFFHHHLDDDQRSLYRDSVDFRGALLDVANPLAMLRRIRRRDEPLFPASHTWMAPCDRITDLDGSGLRRALALEGTEPPYVVFVMSRQRLVNAGVGVRRSTALDAVPAGLAYWDEDGLPTGIPEFVDRDIPQSALEDLQWRP